MRARAVFLSIALLSLPRAAQHAADLLPGPDSHFGFRMGADGRLASADQIEQYFEIVAARSDRVKIVDIGPTTEAHRTIAAIVTAPENLRNLEEIRLANQRLADPRMLAPEEARRIAATHKVVVAIGCSMHASEIGASQAANELLYWLATSADPATVNQLQNAVVIVIPMLNPDGHRLVVDWYNKYRGTPYEGGPLPWADHKYVGHDINRDAFMMNMAENRNLARFFYTEWHPQVFLTMHQMESDGPRFFAPPNQDPINPNYDPIIWREAGLLGSAMTLELERDQRAGVVSNALYDYYWPGYEDSAPLGHNTVCLLTEAARVKIATPMTVPPGDLRAFINLPHPWPGGTWTLRDIVEYDLSAVRGLLRAAAGYRQELVENFYAMGRRAVEAGERGGPFAFIMPPDQYDASAAARLEQLLLQGGVELERALEPFHADGVPYPTGSDIILLSQPFRAYVKTLLERQEYPARPSASTGSSDRPYDVAGWTLPAQMGVDVRTIDRPFERPAMSRVTSVTLAPDRVWGDRRPAYYLIDGRGNAGAIAANRLLAAGLKPSWLTSAASVDGYHFTPGSLVVPSSKAAPVVAKIAGELGLRADGVKGKAPASLTGLSRARVAVYTPWVLNTDEGWTRWVLERYEFAFKTISSADVRAGGLRGRHDVIVLPSVSAELLTAGQPAGTVPPEYAGGLGEEGLAELKAFVEAGGTLICLDQSSSLAIALFGLPVKDVARESRERFFCPGSIVRVDLEPAQPLSYGMPPHTAGFFSFSSAFELTPSATGVQTIARYGDKDVLVSGWLEGEHIISGRAAALQVGVGAGRVVLLGFRVQHRGQSLATFRLLFNAILTAR